MRDVLLANNRIAQGHQLTPEQWLAWQRLERRSEIKALVAALLGVTSMAYGINQLRAKR